MSAPPMTLLSKFLCHHIALPANLDSIIPLLPSLSLLEAREELKPGKSKRIEQWRSAYTNARS